MLPVFGAGSPPVVVAQVEGLIVLSAIALLHVLVTGLVVYVAVLWALRDHDDDDPRKDHLLGRFGPP